MNFAITISLQKGNAFVAFLRVACLPGVQQTIVISRMLGEFGKAMGRWSGEDSFQGGTTGQLIFGLDQATDVVGS